MLGVLKFIGWLLLAAFVLGMLQIAIGYGLLMGDSILLWLLGGAVVLVPAAVWVFRQALKIRW